MADSDTPWAWPIWTPGAWLAGFVKGITKHCYTQNIKALGLMVSEKIFLCSSRSVANLDPKGMIGRIFVGYHKTLLHTKYTGFRPCGFREEDFFHVIHIISLWQIMMPPGHGQFRTQGHGWQGL